MKLLVTSITVPQGRCWVFPSMYCCEPPVWLKPSQKPPFRILAHGGAVNLLVMTHGTNIG